MTIEEKLDSFLLNKDSHTFLLHGPWGVGKTYAVQKWIDGFINKEYNIINISLFGISSINELNSLVLNYECFGNRTISFFKKINQNVSFGCSHFSFSFPLFGFISSMLKEKHNRKKKYLFILDDIERRDNRLSIEEIFGFVDSLPKDNTKVVLVTNLDKFDNSSAFKGFREKVVQEEFNIESPSQEAIEIIIGKSYANHFSSIEYPIKNLRTLIRVKRIVEKYSTNLDYSMLDCIYYCCLNIFENRLDKNELITNSKKDALLYLNTFSLLNSITNYEETIECKKIKEHIEKIENDWEFLYENIKLKNLLSNLNENQLKFFVRDIYECIKKEEYFKLNEIDLPLRPKPLNKYIENGNSVLLSHNPYGEYKLVVTRFLECFKSDEFDILDLFRNYCITVKNCSNFVIKDSTLKNIEKRVNDICINKVPQYVFDNTYYSENEYINSPYFGDIIPDWVLSLEEKMLDKYYVIFNTYYIHLSKNNRINLSEIDHHLRVCETVFHNSGKFNYGRINFDLISLNVLRQISSYLKNDMNEKDWRYAQSFVNWIVQNREKYNFEKSIKYILDKSKMNNIVGLKFSFLAKFLS